ncbi:hypothetical protein [Chryseobacterium flavum]|uniref:hypothetical protein n=1 Tax=Chryseobacterium flavum TaxID=415851 RepID=UPI0028ACAE33|nr:hypothetical protein [Chryseobacterium flavum]
MADIDYNQLLKDMLNAMKQSLTDDWSNAQPYVKAEVNSFINNIKLIGELKLTGKITEEKARLYLEMQKSTMRIVLLTIDGLTIIAVENAINAAINVVKNTVNTAIGWAIL